MRFFGILAFSAVASVLAAPIPPLASSNTGDISIEAAILHAKEFLGLMDPKIAKATDGKTTMSAGDVNTIVPMLDGVIASLKPLHDVNMKATSMGDNESMNEILARVQLMLQRVTKGNGNNNAEVTAKAEELSKTAYPLAMLTTLGLGGGTGTSTGTGINGMTNGGGLTGGLTGDVNGGLTGSVPGLAVVNGVTGGAAGGTKGNKGGILGGSILPGIL